VCTTAARGQVVSARNRAGMQPSLGSKKEKPRTGESGASGPLGDSDGRQPFTKLK
jgi:hypothetical protein